MKMILIHDHGDCVDRIRRIMRARGVPVKSVEAGPDNTVSVVFTNKWSFTYDEDDFVRWNDEQLGNVAFEILAAVAGGCSHCGEGKT